MATNNYNVVRQLQRFATNKRYHQEHHTANDTLTVKETGSTHTNLGASGTVTLTLPQNAVKGNRYTFAVMAAQVLQIDPGSAGAIYLGNQKLSDDAAVGSGVIGNVITLEADGNGDWVAVAQYGDWVDMSSNALWATAPWTQARLDPTLGYSYFNDFLSNDDYDETDGWTETQATAGTGAVIDGAGGLLQLDSNSTTADQGIQAQLAPEAWLPAAGKDIWFETRLKVTDTVDKVQLFAGLSVLDTTIFATGEISASDYIGFLLDATKQGGADNSKPDFELKKTGQSAEATASVTTLADDTFVRLGFHLSGITTATPYVNGVAGTAITITNCPVTELALSLACLSEGTNDPILTVDWVKLLQLR